MTKLMQKVFIVVFLPICTGLLLGISAIPSHFYYLSFIAFLPLLFASDYIKSYSKPLLIFALQLLIALATFYLMGFYWVFLLGGISFAIGFIVVLPFLFIVPLYILFKKNSSKISSIYFIVAWISVELIQARFQLGTPFFNLGYNLGANVKLIQWYEYTGASGGTLWILIVNFLIYSFIRSLKSSRKQILQKIVVLSVVLLTPIIISAFLYATYKEKGFSKEVLIIHPSIDNTDIKFRVNIYELMDVYLDIMLAELTENTEFVVLPETAITNAGWVKDFNRNLVFNHFYEHTDSFPNLKLITGAVVYEEIPDVEKIKHYKRMPGIRYSENYNTWYYTYNAALQLEKEQGVQMRVKEGLIPYQEYAPFPTIIPHINPIGANFQFSKRNINRDVFETTNNLKTTAFICYEVAFNKMFFDSVKKGAQAFFILSNEGWYENSFIAQQSLQHSIIRAVENRRSITHASNSGISAFINQRGDVLAMTDSKQADFLRHEINLNRKVTLAARLGNYIEILALLTTVSLFIYMIVFGKKHQR